MSSLKEKRAAGRRRASENANAWTASSRCDHTAIHAGSFRFTPRDLLVIVAAHLQTARHALDGLSLLVDGIGRTPLPADTVAVAAELADLLDVHCSDLAAVLALPCDHTAQDVRARRDGHGKDS